ncbi:mechanosensitive ion channel protein 1, mitochondrial-like [Hordeum vulgare subsp. vulgare]|uniref:Mechanosensitive ion channel MscS domain-containing protein n=1 Tax=Hordeum vulgare subsp. vulgare TaxID=112509 RepID=A0A8I6YDK6_HORVV|nr:mechanosensitive ion channel protein 1, mitochondrial-like [Hordeum vulgare subsp. vulgare]
MLMQRVALRAGRLRHLPSIAAAVETMAASWKIKETDCHTNQPSVFTVRHTYSSNAPSIPPAQPNLALPQPNLPPPQHNLPATTTSSCTWTNMLDNAWNSTSDATLAISNQLSDLIQAYPYVPRYFTVVSISYLIARYSLPKFHSKLKKKYAAGTYTVYEAWCLHLMEKVEAHILAYPLFGIVLWGSLDMTTTMIKDLGAGVPFSQISKCVAIVAALWSLQVMKKNFLSSAFMHFEGLKVDKHWLAAFDKVSSLGLIAIGLFGVAEACGVSFESLLAVSGIGGIATAFAAKDVLGNVLSGFYLQFSRPFIVGESIKLPFHAGSIEGLVIEIGLTSTLLINLENLPVSVPNSLLVGQIIVNRSRAQWLLSVTKIPIKVQSMDKVHVISEEIMEKLRAYPEVSLKADAPHCYLTRLGDLYGEFTIGCCLQNMRNEEVLCVEQKILSDAARIIHLHGVELRSPPIPTADLELLMEAARVIKSHSY